MHKRPCDFFLSFFFHFCLASFFYVNFAVSTFSARLSRRSIPGVRDLDVAKVNP